MTDARPTACILCGTPRSGSTLLIGLMEQAGLGAPDSFLRHPQGWARDWGLGPLDLDRPQGWARDWGLGPLDLDRPQDARHYLAAMHDAGRGTGDLFALRLMQENLPDLLRLLDRALPAPTPAGDRARIEAALGPTLFVRLMRADPVAQAVSLLRAEQTGLWHIAPDGTEVERIAPPAPAVYDFGRLEAQVSAYLRWHRGWTDWFAREGIAPFSLSYEDLAADPVAAVTQLCAALDRPAPAAASLRIEVAPLPRAGTDDWADRYRRDLAARA